MRRRREDQIIIACAAFGLLLALVAFLKVVLSPLVAAFAAGLGIGAIGVFALTRRTHRQARSD
jgi:Flp pilus assembly protein TadB